MSDETVELPTVNRQQRKQKRQGFSMDFWEDEITSRKFIQQNLKILQQNAKDDGAKTRFIKPKTDNDTGLTTIGLEFGTERELVTSGGHIRRQIVFDDSNYIKVHYDRNRKLPKRRRKKAEKK